MTVQLVAIPTVHLGCGPDGIGSLLTALVPVWESTAPVRLDFSTSSFISAEAAALLASFKLCRDRSSQPTELDWTSLPDSICKQLGRWRVADLYGAQRFPWTDNAIPLFHQANLERKSLVEYIDKCTVSGVNMPYTSAALMKEIRRSVCEVFTNIFQHAESPIGGMAIGQLYPKVKEVQICVCDCGVGLIRRVQRAGYGVSSPAAAILWALERGHSTRTTPNRPGGLGLFVLREFVKKNGGRLRIYANNGCFSEVAGKPTGHVLTAPFPGTLFELRLKIRDDVAYKLQSE